MKFIKIRTTDVIVSEEEKFVIDEAIKIAQKLLECMSEVDGDRALSKIYTEEDDFITVSDIQESMEVFAFIKGVCKIV